MKTRIAVVDDENRFLRWEDRLTVHRERLVHRSIHVLLFDTRGRLVVQRRHRQKQTHAGYWDISCSGHVDEEDYPRGPDDDLDAVYDACAARELEEELGVRARLEPVGHFGPEAGVHYEQIRLYRATSDGPYTPQPEEVEEVRAVTPAELDALPGPKTATLVGFARMARERGWWH